MTETDISKVLIEGDYATIMGVKYKRVEEPKSFYNKLWYELGKKVGYGIDCDELTDRIMDLIKDNIPESMGEFQPTPQTPEQVAEGLRDAMRQAKKDGVFDNVVDEPDWYDEVEWDEKDNPKPMDDVVNRLVKKYQAQKLWNRVRDELGYSIDCCDEIVDLVEKWLPEYQSAAGSQNVNSELLVDGFNHCLDKIKMMLR